MLTGQSDRGNNSRNRARGAFDFHAKPFRPDLLRVIIDRAFRMRALQEEKPAAAGGNVPQERVAGLITQDPATLRACAVAGKRLPLGCDRDDPGRIGHRQRSWSRVPVIGCLRVPSPSWPSIAAIPENLLDHELFGFEKAHSPAPCVDAGTTETANRGTLFLDEIGDMPLPVPSCCVFARSA